MKRLLEINSIIAGTYFILGLGIGAIWLPLLLLDSHPVIGRSILLWLLISGILHFIFVEPPPKDPEKKRHYVLDIIFMSAAIFMTFIFVLMIEVSE